MISKMIPKSRLFVDILGPSPKEPSREAKWSPRGAKRLRKLIQKEVHRGSKWNKNACILETVRSMFLLTGARRKRMGALAPKTRGFSPHRKIDVRHSANFRHGNSCRRLPALRYFGILRWVKTEKFDDGGFSPHLCV